MDDLLLDPLRRQHHRAAEDLIGPRQLAGALLCAASIAVGCGGGDETEVGAALAGAEAAGGGGSVSWALAERPQTLDPLYAQAPGDALVARQIYEPLIAELTGPYEDGRSVAGLALSADPSADRTVWRLRLRPGVRFQDGSAFNASAVLANVERWLAAPTGQGVLPALLVDAPTPHLVRFILPAPDPRFDQVLASPRLGLVSPEAIDAAAGGELAPGDATAGGTGPFELRERAGDRLLLAQNTAWWGDERGLGPGIDQLEFVVVPDLTERLAQLAEGTVEAASGFGPVELSRARNDPLLTVVAAAGGEKTAIERSLRGIGPGEIAPSLNGLWRTGIDPG